MKYYIETNTGKISFYFFKDVKTVYIEELEGDGLDYIYGAVYKYLDGNFIECICSIVEEDIDNIFYENDYINSMYLQDKYLFYKGDKEKIFITLYNYFKFLYKKEPFENKKFIDIVNKINNAKQYKSDEINIF